MRHWAPVWQLCQLQAVITIHVLVNAPWRLRLLSYIDLSTRVTSEQGVLMNTCVCVCVCARARALDESAAGRQSSRVCLVLGVRLINASDHRPTGRYRPHTTRQLILTLTLTIHFLQYSAIQQVFEMTFDDSISIMSSASRFSAT